MLENKIEQLKNIQLSTEQKSITNDTNKHIVAQINTTIDLQLSAYIDNNLFSSELDKINFYREIESLEEREDLDNIITDFKEINTNISNETQNFFDMLDVKIRAPAYKIQAIKRL